MSNHGGNTLSIWDINMKVNNCVSRLGDQIYNRKNEKILYGHMMDINDILFCEHLQFVASCSDDSSVLFWDLRF